MEFLSLGSELIKFCSAWQYDRLIISFTMDQFKIVTIAIAFFVITGGGIAIDAVSNILSVTENTNLRFFSLSNFFTFPFFWS